MIEPEQYQICREMAVLYAAECKSHEDASVPHMKKDEDGVQGLGHLRELDELCQIEGLN